MNTQFRARSRNETLKRMAWPMLLALAISGCATVQIPQEFNEGVDALRANDVPRANAAFERGVKAAGNDPIMIEQVRLAYEALGLKDEAAKWKLKADRACVETDPAKGPYYRDGMQLNNFVYSCYVE